MENQKFVYIPYTKKGTKINYFLSGGVFSSMESAEKWVRENTLEQWNVRIREVPLR